MRETLQRPLKTTIPMLAGLDELLADDDDDNYQKEKQKRAP